MTPRITKILGKPGTGKSTYITNKIIEKVDNGCTFDDILFTSYSRSASRAIFDKLCVGDIDRKDLEHFGTIYRLANKTLELGKHNYITIEDFEYFAKCNMMDFDVTAFKNQQLTEVDEFGFSGNEKKRELVEGNILYVWWQTLKCIFIYDETIKKAIFARIMLNIKEQEVIERTKTIHDIVYLYEKWEEYKKESEKFEYQDMLQYIFLNQMEYFSPFEYMFLDETHDFGHLQMEVLKLWWNNDSVRQVYITFDPMQCIYRFTGSDPSVIDGILGDKDIVLKKSHRVPHDPWVIATKMARSIKDFSMEGVKSSDENGKVLHIDNIRNLMLMMVKNIPIDTSTFLLLRTNREIGDMLKVLYNRRVPAYGLGRTNTLWKSKFFRDIYNLLVSLERGEQPQREDIRSCFMTMPATLLERGVKTDYNKRRFKLWKQPRIVDDKTSLFYSHFKGDVGSTKDLKEILMQPRIKLHKNHREYLLTTNSKDVFARNINRYVGTIHSSKGLEADNVVIMDYKMGDMWDVVDETRLCYVGVTRTLNNLCIVGDEFIANFL